MNALLGACDNDLYLDYIWSNFGNIDGGRNVSVIKIICVSCINSTVNISKTRYIII